MSFLAIKADSRVAEVSVTADRLAVVLKDGRQISAPLEWFPRLKAASPAEIFADDAVSLLDEAGLDEVGIMADTYNLWEESPATA